MTEKEKDIINRLEKHIYKNGMSDEALVQLIELSAKYLNLLSITEYAKANNMSYNGVKKCRNVITILNQKFVIDNL
jgi:hypothetical protein